MHTQDLIARNRKHAERIIVAQIVLQREGKARDVAERIEIGRLDAGGVELLSVMRNAVVGALQCLLEARRLQGGERLARHTFDIGVEHEDARGCGLFLCGHDFPLCLYC